MRKLHPDHDDQAQGPVGVAVANGAALPGGLAGADLDAAPRAATRVLPGGDQRLPGGVVADREQLEEPGAEALTDQLGEPLVSQLDLGLKQLR